MLNRYASLDTERIIISRFHTRCADCQCPIVPGIEILYLAANPKRGRLKPRVRHVQGQCPDMMEYTVQLVYRTTSKYVHVRALDAMEAIRKATPRRTARDVDMPWGYVVRQGNIEVLRRAA